MHIPLQRLLWLSLALFSLTTPRAEAATFTIDFSTGGVGTVSPQTFTDAGTGLTVDAFYLNSGVWTQTDLFRRDESPDDVGFGVCSPGETCGSGTGGGDFNELSNEKNAEIIRLTLPTGYFWSSVGVSSADNNGSTDPADVERGQLWASGSTLPGTTPGSLFGGLPIWQITGGTVNQTFSGFTSTTESVQYLFFEAYDFLNGTNSNNDYLVSFAVLSDTSITENSVPEPAMLSLLAGGLGVWSAKRRRGNVTR